MFKQIGLVEQLKVNTEGLQALKIKIYAHRELNETFTKLLQQFNSENPQHQLAVQKKLDAIPDISVRGSNEALAKFFAEYVYADSNLVSLWETAKANGIGRNLQIGE